MIVCSCKVVSDHQIRECVTKGCRSWKQLTKSTGVSSECGSCGLLAKSIFDQASADKTSANKAKKLATAKTARKAKSSKQPAAS